MHVSNVGRFCRAMFWDVGFELSAVFGMLRMLEDVERYFFVM